MKSKNSKALTHVESEHIKLVKLCDCVVCGALAPSEAHHPEQGLHLICVAVCKDCHGGPGYPHGWHGDKSRWLVAKMTEPRAINETLRRVEMLKRGINFQPEVMKRIRQRGGNLSSSKIIPNPLVRTA